MWTSLGPRYMPFADLATPDLPLHRLLRLALFQVSVGLTLVLLVGTLNRVMIVEMGVPAAVVALMLALPLLFAPFRALVGYKSDTHRSELGWRRAPFIWKGTLYQFGGFAIMPFALLVLAGMGQSGNAPVLLGYGSAALAFLLVGAGAHVVQTAGLALATDLTPPESHPKVVGLMSVVLLLSMIASALTFGALLKDFSPGRLVQVIQGAALVCFCFNMIAMWKQEPRRPPRGQKQAGTEHSFQQAWAHFCAGDQTIRRLLVVALGTLAFTMADVLLEPFGGQVLGWSVSATTQLTALFALGGLIGFWVASHVIAKGGNPYRTARLGAFVGIPAFLLVILSSPIGHPAVFIIGNVLIGFGGALFGHGTLTATMVRAPHNQVGLALGSWGAVQATAAGVAMALSGALRDAINAVSAHLSSTHTENAIGYVSVYTIEIILLAVTVIVAIPLLKNDNGKKAAEETPSTASLSDNRQCVGAERPQ
ncbi:MAG: PucC family protein [Pseudomonadota bacterium]